MISKSTLEQSIREATEAVQAHQHDLSLVQTRLLEAQRELRLLVELAELRGLEVDQVGGLAVTQSIDVAPNGSPAEPRGRAPSPMKTTLLAAVIEILAEHGEPMQIRELMAAVQKRGIAIPGSGQQANLIAHISRDKRIVRPRRGFYALREWGIEDAKPAARSKRGRARRNSGVRT